MDELSCQIVKVLGVHHTTVSTQRKDLEENGDVAKLAASVDTLEREQPCIRKPVSVFIPEEIGPPEDIFISEEGHEK